MGEKKNQQAGGHKALYRKYRSKSLDEIKGQEHITSTLKNALESGKISHAYLFTGPRGTGKTSIARILAHEINDLPYEDEKTHLDIIEIDAASNRRIDDARELRDKIHIAPVSAKYKVYIIDEVHMLTTESFNALLKTLEEPPSHAIFILATTEVHKLPATIISRTQRHSFRFIPKQQIKEHLAEIAKNESIKIDDEALDILTEHGGGSFRDSISLLDQVSGSQNTVDAALVELLLGIAPKAELESLLNSANNGSSKEIFEKTDKLLAEGLTPGALAMQLIDLIRNKITSGVKNPNLIEALSKLIDVQGAQYPRLKLETILLEINPEPKVTLQEPPTATQPQTTTKPTTTKPVTDNKSPETPRKQNSEPDKPEETPKTINKTSLKSSDFSIEQHWPEVLDAMKSKNNPLYTVLRMAAPELENGELLLNFNFPFHQKKVDEAKHQSLLSQTIQELFNIEVIIKTAVDKKKVAERTLAAAVDPAHASLIQNVQDIMGGGEVVKV